VLVIIAAVGGSTLLAWLAQGFYEALCGKPSGIPLDESDQPLVEAPKAHWSRSDNVVTVTAPVTEKNCRPPAWSMAMLVTSYLLLWPGLTQVIFSFNIVVSVLGHRIDVQPEKDQKSCTETITGLVNLLEKTGSHTGAVLIVLYAVVVPAVKLLLLAMGELLRFSRNRCGIRIARVCISMVQAVSKWACPDMFAYILLVHLVRVLQHQPIILTAAQLDVGFSSFSVFCVCSTISSLGISLPPLPGEGATMMPFLVRCLGKQGIFYVALGLAAVFLGLFGAGIFMPVMALRIDERQLYPPAGSVPYSAKPIIEALAIPDLLRSDVSIISCTLALAGEIFSGEANSIFAFAMFGCCVLVLCLADVALLVLAARRFSQQPSMVPKAQRRSRNEKLLPSYGSCPFMPWAKVFRKLAMLEVCIMGVYVITFCLGIYKEQGIIVSTCDGLLVLISAEVMHTLLFWTVAPAVEYSDGLEQINYAYKAAQSEEDPDVEGEQSLNAGCCTNSSLLSSLFSTQTRELQPNSAKSKRTLA